MARSEQIFAAIFFEPLHDFSDVLGALTRANQQRVRSLDYDEIVDTHGGHELRSAPEKIPTCLQGVSVAWQNIVAGIFREQFVNGGPGADVAPADLGGNDEYGRSARLARCRLQDSVVHRNVLQLGIDGAKFALVAAFADAFAERFQGRARFRKMLIQIFEKCRSAPEKHPGVPVIVAGAGVNFRDRKRRLFSEAPHCIDRKTFRIERVSHPLDVAETRFRARRGNPEDDHAALTARDFERGTHDDAIALRIRDVMIGGEYGQQCIAARGVANMQSGKGNRGGSVAADGHRQNSLTRGCRQLLSDLGSLLAIGDRPDALGGNQWPQTRDRLLQHGLLADDVEQLLGGARAAARPEACAASTRQDYRVHCQRFAWHASLVLSKNRLSKPGFGDSGLAELRTKARQIRDVRSNRRGALLWLQRKFPERCRNQPALAALVRQRRSLPMNVAGSVENNEQLKTVVPGFRLHRGTEFPALSCKVRTCREQSLMDALTGQMQRRHFD